MRKIVYGLALALFAGLMTVFPAARIQAGGGHPLADFENGLPFLVDEFNNGLGFVTWGDAFENVALSARQLVPGSALAVPGKENQANTVLAVAYDISGWGGFTYVINDGVNWTSEDWTPYDAISFWFYGSNTGGQMQLDLFDNRGEGSTGDSAERWFYRFDDDAAGWRQFTIPFGLFQRRTDFQPGGAPDDGLGLDQVSGIAFGFPPSDGPQLAYIDDIWVTTATNTEEVTIVGGEEPQDESAAVVDDVTWDSREWNLIWSDEFDEAAGTPINEENWTCEIGGQGWGNQEHEYYTSRVENVSHVGDGTLAITAIEETLPDSRCWYGTCQYTSARCITQDKIEFTYGRVEARIKVPFGQGIWPAFWMLGANFREVGWPGSGEIDIMEHIGKEPYNVYGTVHGPSYSGGSGIGGSTTLDEPVSDDFHIFAIDWDEDAIRWYLDGELYFTFTPDDLGNRRWVFDHDFFLLMNVAVGGQWPGYPDETTTFPQQMLVDYIRVYELAE